MVKGRSQISVASYWQRVITTQQVRENYELQSMSNLGAHLESDPHIDCVCFYSVNRIWAAALRVLLLVLSRGRSPDAAPSQDQRDTADLT